MAKTENHLSPTHRRKRLRFSLRAILIALSLVGVALALLVTPALRQKRAVAEIERLGGTVFYDYQYNASENSIDIFMEPPDKWYVNLLGRDFFYSVAGVYGYQEQHYPSVGGVFNSFGPSRLDTEFHRNTDECLRSLRGIRSLQFLNLSETAITDAGLQEISSISIKKLNLRKCNVTDAGLEAITQIHGLSAVSLFSSDVTDEGARSLQLRMPNVDVHHWGIGEFRDGKWVRK